MILLWYLWVEILGLLALALGWPTLRALPDRGYCAAKTLGTLLVGLVLWWGFALGLLRNSAGGAVLAIVVLAAAAGAGARRGRGGVRRELLDWVRRRWRLVVTVEVLQLAAFAGWCWVRANDPAADHTEEPMDLMLLVAASTSDSFPPIDPWLAGYPISYYYLGYWLLATLGHLAGSAPEITYNLGQATWWSLLLVGTFGLAYDLSALSQPDAAAAPNAGAGDQDRAATGTGLLAALLVGVTANLALPVEWGSRYLAGTATALWTENWWWWRSARVVADVGLDGEHVEVITEFPFFSYLLGDNHPHLLAMPVVVAALTLALAVFASASARASATAAQPRRRRLTAVIPGGGIALVGILAVAGSIAAINTWDLPAVWSVLLLAVAAAAADGTVHDLPAGPIATGTAAPKDAAAPKGAGAPAGRRAMLTGLSFGLLLVLATAILYLPYHLTASSQLQGLLPNLFHPTPLERVLVMFATLLPAAALLVIAAWEPGAASLSKALAWWLAILAASLAWLLLSIALAAWGGAWETWLSRALAGESRARLPAIALSRWIMGWPTLAAVAAGLALTLEALRARWVSSGVRRQPGVTFALLLAAAGLALILAPELMYLHDSFASRMNTVFKFWYQAWLLLACAGALGVALAWRRGGGGRAAALLALLAIAPGLCYPVMAMWTKTAGFGSTAPTLDALAWLEQWRPDEKAALDWVRSSTAPGSVVVQRSGASYRPEHNLPSIVSGRPTLLGWGGHEFQWRGDSFASFSAGRDQALTRIYRASSASDLDAVLREWKVDYVYLGPEERTLYALDASHEDLLAAAMDLVFENARVRVFRRRG